MPVPLRHAIASQSIKSISAYWPLEIARLAWSIANLGYVNVPLLDALSAQALRRLSECGANRLESTPLSLAPLGMVHAPLLHAISAAARRTISEYLPEGCTCFAWSVATLEYNH